MSLNPDGSTMQYGASLLFPFSTLTRLLAGLAKAIFLLYIANDGAWSLPF
jgi:hypothetical protein